MTKRQNLRKIISLVLSFIVIFGNFGTFVDASEVSSANGISSEKSNIDELATGKFMPDVLKDMESEDQVEVLLYLSDQVDTQLVANDIKSLGAPGKTPNKIKQEVRRGVVESLKDKSHLTQRNIVDYLDNEIDRGNVEEYTTYHIVNMVYVKASKEVIENLSYMKEVEKIYKNNVHSQEVPKIEEIVPSTEDLEWNVERVGADKVWDMGFDGTGIVVANIDSGVDWTHPALKHKWRGYNPVTEEIDAEENWFDPVYNAELPTDSDQHGTHVMGTMVGQEDDGSNKIGVAPGARWIASRVFDDWGYTSDAILLAAAEWMLAPGGNPDAAPDVVNNSWGGGAGLNDYFRDAVINWRSAEIFPVFSAGNQQPGEPAPWPGSISIPSNYPESFAVAATDPTDTRAYFSKLGPSPYDESLIKPDISGPGVSIRSSVPGGYEGGWSGTSMSAPAVSGAVALLLSYDSSLTIEDIEELIADTADPLTDEDYPESPNMAYGYGMVDAHEALRASIDGAGRIEGTLLGDGEDQENAVINHEQNVFEIYSGSNANIIAEVIDDVAIRDVELLVKQEGKSYWLLVPMDKISGNHREGIYSAEITHDMLVGESLKYKIRVKDYAGNYSATKDYIIDIKFGVMPGEYFEGFEDGAVGWTTSGDWEIGKPSEGSPSAFEGENVAGTILNGTYNPRGASTLLSPPIDFRNHDLEFATLRFQEWSEFEQDYDFGYVYVTDDFGESWNLMRSRITGEYGSWEKSVIDLSEYIGSETPIFVAFQSFADTSNNFLGWYIDNVELVVQDTDSPASPTNLEEKSNIRGIRLGWEKVNDADLSHYNVYRTETLGGEYVKIGQTHLDYFTDDTAEAEESYYYVVTAEDYNRNVSDYSNEISAVPADFDLVLGTDFEEDNGGFVTGINRGQNNSWEWGVPENEGPFRAASGEKLWATNLSGPYDNDTNAYIETPYLDIPEDKNGYLTFNHWVDIEGTTNFWDYGQVFITEDDGDNWINITPTESGKYGGKVEEWIAEEISLPGYSGKTIKIRFNFRSDYSGWKSGWYIDDVYVVASDSHEETINSPAVDQLYKESPKLKDTKKESKKPEIMEPEFNRNKTQSLKEYRTVDDVVVQNTVMAGGKGIPVLNPVVTILETRRSVKPHPITGEFSTRVSTGTFTLKAEAYGYYSMEKTVEVEDDKVSQVDFLLEPVPQGTITGRVIDRYYETPVANANIRLVEDPNQKPVKTDSEGYFTMDGVYEGEYTLKVTVDGFNQGEVTVNVEGDTVTDIEIRLKRFVNVEEELIYDDGTAENGTIATAANDGIAVRFTPSKEGTVKGANIFFWDASWPTPGGEKIGFVIYDSNQERVGEPMFQDVNRGEWNYIDLSEFGFSTDEDFYIATVQYRAGNQSPAMGVDENSPSNRTYVIFDGVFDFLSEYGVEGAAMIRAVMEYEMEIPIITSPEPLTYTDQDTITVEGTVTLDGKVNIYVNDEKVATIDTENKFFSAEVELPEERNVIKVTGEVEGRETEPSEEVVVIKDHSEPISNIQPSEDISLRAGEELTVSFNGLPGHEAYFKIMLPFEIQSDAYEIPMDEIEPGLYRQDLVIPEDMIASDLLIEVTIIDNEESRLSKMAPGRLTVIGDMENLVSNSVIIDDEAFHMDYLNKNSYAQSKLIKWYNLGKEVYTKINEDTIVTESGRIVTLDELPSKLKHFDENGSITYYEK